MGHLFRTGWKLAECQHRPTPPGLQVHVVEVEWTYTHVIQCPKQQKYNLGRLRFNRRGASTPLWGVESCSLPGGWPNPIPAIPPYVVRTPERPFTSTPITLQLQFLVLDMLIDNCITVTVTVFSFSGGLLELGYSYSSSTFSPGIGIVIVAARMVRCLVPHLLCPGFYASLHAGAVTVVGGILMSLL